MYCIVAHSFHFLLGVMSGSECTLVMYYLNVAILFLMGWFEKKLTVVSVVVGFRNMSKF